MNHVEKNENGSEETKETESRTKETPPFAAPKQRRSWMVSSQQTRFISIKKILDIQSKVG